jgi:tetratricopeptide (TPR) repeat protein
MSRETIDALCERAKKAVAQGQNEHAKAVYLQALSLRSDMPDVHYGLATVCFLLKDLPSAAYHFKECTRLDPLRAGAFINLGAVYNHLQQHDEAVAMLKRGIQLDGRRAEGHYNLALVYRKMGQDDLAVQAYREAVKVNPRMADAHLNIANIYLEHGKLPQAVVHYKQALEIRPKWDKARQGLVAAQEMVKASRGGAAAVLKPDAVDVATQPPDDSSDQLLKVLHRSLDDTDKLGQELQLTLQQKMESALTDLTHIILNPKSSSMEVALNLSRFDATLKQVNDLHERLRNSLHRLKLVGEQLINA